MAAPAEPTMAAPAEPMALMEIETEPNDTILSANEIQLDPSSSIKVDGEIAASNDVDIFEVKLNAEDTLLADIDAKINDSSLDAVLTIFDLNGNQLVQKDDNSFVDGGITVGGVTVGGVTVTEPDPFQQFTAPEDGTYYFGVSSSPNLNYDPNVADSGIGVSSGFYSLELSFADEAIMDDLGLDVI